MSSLGFYPVGSRPKATLKRNGVIIMYGVLSAAGIGALAAVATARASASAAMAGVGAVNPVLRGAASASMSTGGAGTFAGNLTARGIMVLSASGLGALTSPNAITKSSASLSASGVGQLAATIFSQNRSAMTTGGSGSLAGVILSRAHVTATFQGMGGMEGSDSPSSAASFDGIGVLSAVGYAFYSDAEKAAPKEEVRVVYVPFEERHPTVPAAMVANEPRTTYAPAENRVAVVPFENRVYEVSNRQRTVVGPSNRRRTL